MTEVGCDPELSQLSHPNPDQAKEGNIGTQQSPEVRDREGSSRQHHLLEARNKGASRLWKEGGGDMDKEAGLGQEWQHTCVIIALGGRDGRIRSLRMSSTTSVLEDSLGYTRSSFRRRGRRRRWRGEVDSWNERKREEGGGEEEQEEEEKGEKGIRRNEIRRGGRVGAEVRGGDHGEAGGRKGGAGRPGEDGGGLEEEGELKRMK